MFRVYGENGITFKVAVKLETQAHGYRRFIAAIRKRYREMHGAGPVQGLNAGKNDRFYLFPSFGKRGRAGKRGETCFGEPDMIIGTKKANLIFEFETGAFSGLIHRNQAGVLKTQGLPYQLCRFYQLGALLLRLDEQTIADPVNRSEEALYQFAGGNGRRTSHYYFSYSEDRDRHSFEGAVRSLLGKKQYFVVSVTNDRRPEDAIAGLGQMLRMVGDGYDRKRFIALTYSDLKNAGCFGDGLQLQLGGARQGFQAISLR
ncbi:MAG: hypothetical protein P9M08_02030 [Candidatus Erginobacter occultus]|nr:hypothetical protein [Candidatus Erginobacter occultus]